MAKRPYCSSHCGLNSSGIDLDDLVRVVVVVAEDQVEVLVVVRVSATWCTWWMTQTHLLVDTMQVYVLAYLSQMKCAHEKNVACVGACGAV